MATVRLTEAAIRKMISDSSSGARVELTDAATPGLKIRANGEGRAVWSIKLRDATGKQIRVNLGEYPTVGISDARTKAAATRHQVRQEGRNPNEERKAVREAARTPVVPEETGMTLDALILAYYDVAGIQRKSRYDAEKRIRSVFGTFLNRPLKSITRAELLQSLDRWPSRSSAAAGVRYVRPLLKWAADRGHAPIELTVLKEPEYDRIRERALSQSELAILLRTLRTEKNAHADILLVILHTAARLNQAAGMRWQEIQDGFWTIPLERVKSTNPRSKRSPHIIPLSRQIAAIIETRRTPDSKPDDLVFPSSKGTIVGNWDRWSAGLNKKIGFSDWTRHDLRRSASTMMGELGILPHVIESALGHMDIHSPLAGVYNKSRYAAEVGFAFQKLAYFYDSLVDDESVGLTVLKENET